MKFHHYCGVKSLHQDADENWDPQAWGKNRKKIDKSAVIQPGDKDQDAQTFLRD